MFELGWGPARSTLFPCGALLRSAGAGAGPASLLATATHDHKRGEDVRARLAVLSERPEAWATWVRPWLAGAPAQIDPADAYHMHQTLAGALPLDLDMDDAAGLKVFGERVSGWFTKALREGKLRSSWAVPNADYERACLAYLDHCLGDPAYRAALSDLVEEIAPAGAIKGLAQALLRCASPGVPDTYQGTELWDFSLVDPDNLRPVDFALRQEMLRQTSPDDALADWRTGGVKQRVFGRTLKIGRAHA